MRLTIILLFICSIGLTQDPTYTPSNTEDLGTKYQRIDNNFDEVVFYNIPAWQAWNEMSTLNRFSVYANDSLGNSRFVVAMVGDIEAAFNGVDRFRGFVDETIISDRNRNTVWLGDLVKDWNVNYPKQRFIDSLYQVTDRIADNDNPMMFILGNHECNCELTTHTDTALSKQDQRDYLFDSLFAMETRKQFHTNSLDVNACYYFVDDSTFKVRMIFLDVYDSPQMIDGNSFRYGQNDDQYISGDQLEWYSEEALALPDSEWQVFIVSHEPYYTTTFDNAGASILTITLAFINNTTYSVSGNDADNPYTLSGDYSSINGFNGVVIANIHGHGHEQTQSINNGINIIQILSMRPNSVMTTRIIGTSSEDAADFIILDKLQNNIRFIRYGAGGLNYTGSNITGDRGLDNSITY